MSQRSGCGGVLDSVAIESDVSVASVGSGSCFVCLSLGFPCICASNRNVEELLGHVSTASSAAENTGTFSISKER